MTTARLHLREMQLAVVFVGVLAAISVDAWNLLGPYCALMVVPAVIVLPMGYLVLLLMLRQHRGQHPAATRELSPDGDDTSPLIGRGTPATITMRRPRPS